MICYKLLHVCMYFDTHFLLLYQLLNQVYNTSWTLIDDTFVLDYIYTCIILYIIIPYTQCNVMLQKEFFYELL